LARLCDGNTAEDRPREWEREGEDDRHDAHHETNLLGLSRRHRMLRRRLPTGRCWVTDRLAIE